MRAKLKGWGHVRMTTPPLANWKESKHEATSFLEKMEIIFFVKTYKLNISSKFPFQGGAIWQVQT